MSDDFYKTPRLFTPAPLAGGAAVPLPPEAAHYLLGVLRRADGDPVRVFNGRDGEYLARLGVSGKRNATLAMQDILRPQPPLAPRLHLLFPPLKKDRLDFLIEKAVELGATDLHPVITERTEVRAVNEGRLHAQCIEAAEQCERLTIPALHPIIRLENALAAWPAEIPVITGLERGDCPDIHTLARPQAHVAALIGPAGGWSDFERDLLGASPAVVPVSLGANILRAETAALVLLASLRHV
jgi:16S rRNA (uracil1498-N3)-methyltransferase